MKYRTWFTLAIIMIIMTITLGGCRTVRYVSVPEYHTEWRIKTDTFVRADSVTVKDSVTLYMKGDTVFRDRVSFREKLRYIYKAKTDTVTVRDSVTVAVPVVEKKTSLWTGIKSCFCVSLCIAVFLAGLWVWLKKKILF